MTGVMGALDMSILRMLFRFRLFRRTSSIQRARKLSRWIKRMTEIGGVSNAAAELLLTAEQPEIMITAWSLYGHSKKAPRRAFRVGFSGRNSSNQRLGGVGT